MAKTFELSMAFKTLQDLNCPTALCNRSGMTVIQIIFRKMMTPFLNNLINRNGVCRAATGFARPCPQLIIKFACWFCLWEKPLFLGIAAANFKYCNMSVHHSLHFYLDIFIYLLVTNLKFLVSFLSLNSIETQKWSFITFIML